MLGGRRCYGCVQVFVYNERKAKRQVVTWRDARTCYRTPHVIARTPLRRNLTIIIMAKQEIDSRC